MPFETTPNLPGNPLVTVKFSGLMVLHPGADNTCNVGVHKVEPTHLFQAILVVSKRGQVAPTLITLLTGPLLAPFLIRLDPDPGAGDFKVFEKGPFNPTAPGSDDKDSRWAINLQSPDGDIKVNEGAMPFVTLKTGVLFTPSLSKKVLKPKFKRPPAKDAMELEHFAAELAVAIDRPPGKNVKLEWTDPARQMNKTLPLDDEDTHYTIYFINEPPNLGAAEHDELKLYYKILQRNGAPVPETEQCTLDVEIPPQFRLDQIPCNPVTLNP